MDQRYRGNGVLEFAGGLFGTSLDGLEIVMRANYYLRSKQSRRCVCFARIASKHCTYQAARRWRRDEGASVSSGSGVSRRRVLSWRGCCGESARRRFISASTAPSASLWAVNRDRGDRAALVAAGAEPPVQ